MRFIYGLNNTFELHKAEDLLNQTRPKTKTLFTFFEKDISTKIQAVTDDAKHYRRSRIHQKQNI